MRGKKWVRDGFVYDCVVLCVSLHGKLAYAFGTVDRWFTTVSLFGVMAITFCNV